MELCSKGHDEICFEGRNCPFCDYIKTANSEKEDLEIKIARLERENEELLAESV